MKTKITLILAGVLVPLWGANAQGAGTAAEALEKVSALADRSAAELAEVRARIDEEKVPLLTKREALEDELYGVKEAYERVLRVRDARTLDLSSTRAKIDARKKQNEFLQGELDKFAREFESVLHISELQRYKGLIADSKRATAADADIEEAFDGQIDLIDLAATRLEGVVGSAVFDGEATDQDGLVSRGKFVLVGPLGFFAGENEGHSGLAQSKTNSLEPTVVEVPQKLQPLIGETVASGAGLLPLDVTQGEAVKLEETKETVGEEIAKGGLVMYPLLGLGGLSMLVGLIKWGQILLVSKVSVRRFRQFVDELEAGGTAAAEAVVAKVRGPIGTMLRSGARHHEDPPELVEEVLYETVMKARERLNSFIPLIKITAAAAPLLGLLGTVSGMINTFKLITVFGTGDASTFSSGISEALITTKWGLIVAIPCLLLAAFLTRKARGVLDDMEKLALAFVNHLRGRRGEPPAEEDGPEKGGAGPDGEDADDGPEDVELVGAPA